MNKYHINLFFSEEDQEWVADIPDLFICSATGDTPEEALREVLIGQKAWLEVAREKGRPIPEHLYTPENAASAPQLRLPETDYVEKLVTK
jgi:predicted RNase H-like HicB family nuclease